MAEANGPGPRQPRRLPVWLAYPLALIVWEVVPWAISFLSPRNGWTAGHPGIWNWAGLIPVVGGTFGLLRGVALHGAKSPEGIGMELDREYLLQGNLYRFSRHPMYLAELTLLLCWVIFFGSVSLLIALGVWFVFFQFFAVPQEERVLEARFGEAYRGYKGRVRRWFGWPSRKE